MISSDIILIYFTSLQPTYESCVPIVGQLCAISSNFSKLPRNQTQQGKTLVNKNLQGNLTRYFVL